MNCFTTPTRNARVTRSWNSCRSCSRARSSDLGRRGARRMRRGGQPPHRERTAAGLQGRAQGQDLILITRDEREDWWRQQSEFIGPRPELAPACYELSERRLFLIRPADLLSRASALQIEVGQESSLDAERVTDDKKDPTRSWRHGRAMPWPPCWTTSTSKHQCRQTRSGSQPQTGVAPSPVKRCTRSGTTTTGCCAAFT
jgi:hypothetical protein